MAETIETTMAKLPNVISRLQQANEEAAEKAQKAVAEQAKKNEEDIKLYKEIIDSNKEGSKASKEATSNLAALQKSMAITADAAKATEQWQKSFSGKADERKKLLEEQGKVAEDDKEYSKLTYQAQKKELEERLKNKDISPAAKKELEDERSALMKKDGSRLDKIAAGITGMWALGKASAKTALKGGIALLGTLAFGAALIAFGKFMQSPQFKEWVEVTIPAIMGALTWVSDSLGAFLDFFTLKFWTDTWTKLKEGKWGEAFGDIGEGLTGMGIAIGLVVAALIPITAMLVPGLFLAGLSGGLSLLKKAFGKLGTFLGGSAAKGITPPVKPPAGSPVPTKPPMVNAAGQQIGKGGKVLSGAALNERMKKLARNAPEPGKMAKMMQKFPKVGKFLGLAKRIPGLSAVFAISDLVSILSNDEMSMKQKSAGIAGIFGGVATSVLGAAAGGMVGGPIGAAIGGLAGYFGGERLAKAMAQWMLGEKVDALPTWPADFNAMMNGNADKKGSSAGAPPVLSSADDMVGGGSPRGALPVLASGAKPPPRSAAWLAAESAAKAERATVAGRQGGGTSNTQINAQSPTNTTVYASGRVDDLRFNKFANLNEALGY